ncbi:MAG: hypothetical protein NTX22_00295 [Ignavibacteriales bacterium]|nr:hypothetical protein [Ignavibacteriales bacterium]
MKNSEENSLRMFENVSGLLKENQEITSSIQQFAESEAELNQLIADIKTTNQMLINAANGKTDEKTAAEEDLEDYVILFSRKFFVYARRNAVEDLKALIGFKEYEIKKLRDRELIDRAESIRKKAVEHLAKLEKYGIKQVEIDLLDAKIKRFELTIGEQGTGYSERGGARKSLNVLFEQASLLLKEEIDGLVESYKDENSDFYNQYITARGIKNLGVRHRKKEEPAIPVGGDGSGTGTSGT